MADKSERDHLQEEAEEVAHNDGSSQAGLHLHLLPTDQAHGPLKIIDDHNTRGGLIIAIVELKLVLVGEAEHILVTTGGDTIAYITLISLIIATHPFGMYPAISWKNMSYKSIE